MPSYAVVAGAIACPTHVQSRLSDGRFSPSSPVRPAVPIFRASDIGNERRGPNARKHCSADVYSSPPPKPIIAGHRSCAAKSAGRMASNIATGALSRTHASPGAGGAAARAYLGEINDTRKLAWRRSIEVLRMRRTAADIVAVSARPRRGLLADAWSSVAIVGMASGRPRRVRAGWR